MFFTHTHHFNASLDLLHRPTSDEESMPISSTCAMKLGLIILTVVKRPVSHRIVQESMLKAMQKNIL